VNNGEPLFLSEFGVWLLGWVLSEARLIFAFELRGVRFAGASVSFYIKLADGLQLPEIMKWIKQTFAVWFHWDDGRTGHIWGAQGRTRSVERVVVPRRHGGPPNPAPQRSKPTGAPDPARETLSVLLDITEHGEPLNTALRRSEPTGAPKKARETLSVLLGSGNTASP
jgi:hypothetical protein